MSKACEALSRRLALIAVEEKRFQNFCSKSGGRPPYISVVGRNYLVEPGERSLTRQAQVHRTSNRHLCHKRIVCIQYLGMGQKHGLNRQPVIWACMIYDHTSCADITLDRVRTTLLNGPEVSM
jgi:hypothetical protein